MAVNVSKADQLALVLGLVFLVIVLASSASYMSTHGS